MTPIPVLYLNSKAFDRILKTEDESTVQCYEKMGKKLENAN